MRERISARSGAVGARRRYVRRGSHRGGTVAQLGVHQAETAVGNRQAGVAGDGLLEGLTGAGGVAGQQSLVAALVGLRGGTGRRALRRL